MKTGLKKAQKETTIWFNEAEPVIHVRTYNTSLRNRLTDFSAAYPACCRLVEDDPESACKEFEVQKGRFSFRLTAPYSEERRKRTSAKAKENGIKNIKRSK